MKSVQLAPRDNIDDVISKHGLVFPMYVSPKIDGIRAAHKSGQMLTRSMKAHKNKHIQSLFGPRECFMGMDGELTVGDPWDPDCFENTDGICRQINSTPDVVFNVFDRMDFPQFEYWRRLEEIEKVFKDVLEGSPHARLVRQKLVHSYEELDAFEEEQLVLGYEGVMARDPHGLYKYGRCTAKERNILKVKRFEHDEAQVIGYEELMHNENEAYISENGAQKRSTHQENLVPGGTLGALICRCLVTGQEFNVGTGFKKDQRDALWKRIQQGDGVIGEILRYKHFPKGRREAPRHPVYAGFRQKDDM